MSDNKTPTWATRDGREIPLDEMFTGHIGNATASLRKWLKHEKDPDQKADLRGWQRRFRRELSKRAKAWREKHAHGRG